ncbi:MAG: uncharacterized protein QOC60_740, partial [Frankiaceae bacterium]|nr:uncharacterized protein [Frankiaceae bacterium]
ISFWRSLFLTGHGGWSLLENAVLGPFLAIISFVCSIGNVPLAAALWSGGISFGGVIAFVFADLITVPLLLIYRKYYGTRLTLRLLATFWATMTIAGLVTERLFAAVGALPAPVPAGMGMVRRNVFGWNYTTVLDFLALAVFAGLYWLYRNRERFGGGSEYAKDPVCGMQVEKANPGSVLRHDGTTIYFCSDHCRERFVAAPERFAGPPCSARPAASGSGSASGSASASASAGALQIGSAPDGWQPPAVATDPVCGMAVDPATAAAHAEVDGTSYHFCSVGCRDAFVAAPTDHLGPAHTNRFMD